MQILGSSTRFARAEANRIILRNYTTGHTSTNIQGQKLSIAAFEPACSDPSPEGLPRAILCIKRLPKTKNTTHPGLGFR